MDCIRTFSASGKCLYEEHFATKEKAYAEYVNTAKSLEKTPKGIKTTVARYDKDGYLMNMMTVVGKC